MTFRLLTPSKMSFEKNSELTTCNMLLPYKNLTAGCTEEVSSLSIQDTVNLNDVSTHMRRQSF